MKKCFLLSKTGRFGKQVMVINVLTVGLKNDKARADFNVFSNDVPIKFSCQVATLFRKIVYIVQPKLYWGNFGSSWWNTFNLIVKAVKYLQNVLYS